jgi:MFS family permease
VNTPETPETSLPGKQELLDFQDRWHVRAGLAALGGAFLIAGSLVYQRAGLHVPSSSSNADQLAFFHAHSGRLIVSSIIQGIGFALFAVPLAYLFRAAAGRAARMRGGFMPLILLGPLAFGIGVLISAFGSQQAANDFAKQQPAVVQHARQQAQAAQAAPPKSGGGKAKGTGATGASTGGTGGTTTTHPATTTGATTTHPATTSGTTTTTAAKPKTPDQAASDARESLADHLNRHTTVLVIGSILSTIGVLAFVFGMVYTALWSMRTGLLTRFWGAVMMAFGLFLVIPLLPPLPGIVLLYAALGLMFLGRWPRPLPPAWAAGEAIPWQRPGDMGPPPPAGGNGDGTTVEGSGREVSEQPLPEQGEAPPEPPYGDSQGQRRKKRKRRK